MSTLVVAEKPSVARDIARVLGATRKREGYLEGNGYCVTWALGHLVHFAEPDDYGPPWKGRWSAAQLPMVPDRWRLKTDPKTVSQLKIVEGLLKAPEHARLVCATDAGREGEHIFRLIYEHARCRKPFDRLWVSSLTDEAIRAGFGALKPGSAYDDLARAARARAQADWLVGMNLTRAYTVHNKVLCTIGRVQTPTLAMIVARDAEIASFKKTFFYELVATLAEGFDARYSRDGETRIAEKAEAERLHAELSPHRTGTVKELEQEVRVNRPPPLYDLTTLQRDANRRFGLTAAQVLELAQALYETHKLISYPRTESRHIGEDMVDKLPGILAGLDHPQAPQALERLKSGHTLGRAYVDKTRLTDHHAILPTGKAVPAGLSPSLRRVYDLVQTRFVCVFLPDQRVEETRVRLDIGGADFVARGARVLEPGWTAAQGVGRSDGPSPGGRAGRFRGWLRERQRPGRRGRIGRDGSADPAAMPGGAGPAAPRGRSDRACGCAPGPGAGDQSAPALHGLQPARRHEERRAEHRGPGAGPGHGRVRPGHPGHPRRDHRKADPHRLCGAPAQAAARDREGPGTDRGGRTGPAQPGADRPLGAAAQGGGGGGSAGRRALRRDRGLGAGADSQGLAGRGLHPGAGGPGRSGAGPTGSLAARGQGRSGQGGSPRARRLWGSVPCASKGSWWRPPAPTAAAASGMAADSPSGRPLRA